MVVSIICYTLYPHYILVSCIHWWISIHLFLKNTWNRIFVSLHFFTYIQYISVVLFNEPVPVDSDRVTLYWYRCLTSHTAANEFLAPRISRVILWRVNHVISQPVMWSRCVVGDKRSHMASHGTRSNRYVFGLGYSSFTWTHTQHTAAYIDTI